MTATIQNDGLLVASNLVETLHSNRAALDTITPLLNDKIKSVGTLLSLEENYLSNTLLEIVADELNVQLINVYDKEGTILFSNGEIDLNNTVIASNHEEKIGTAVNDEHILNTSQTKTPYSSVEYDEIIKKDVLHIYYPLTINNNLEGVISVGLSLNNMNSLRIEMIIQTITIGLISLIILGTILYINSTNVIKVIHLFGEQMVYIAQGNLQLEIPNKVLNKNNEFGRIAKSMVTMKDSLISMISTIIEKSETLSSTAEELNATL